MSFLVVNPLLYAVAAIGIAVMLYRFWNKNKSIDLSSQHVFVVGGSSGIGKAVAELAVNAGANVTIVARDIAKLESTADALSSIRRRPNQRIRTVTLDITSGFDDVEKAIRKAEDETGPIDMLVCCAGTAICGRLEDMSINDIRFLTELNYLGTVWSVRALLPAMKSRDKGSIVLVSSQAALVGIYGYSAYGATKWAVRGLGESLIQETVGTNVTVTLCFPPDTDTPGFEVEEASKPTETKIISGSGGLYSPQSVAEKLIRDTMAGNPYSTIGLEGWMLLTLCGTTSVGFFNTYIQCILMGPLRIVLMAYEYYFHYVIKKCKKDKNINKKAK